ncbi:MAG: HAD-IA family hydrolase [Cellvibrionales bacterium]|nr:HAD-IA family hydrolase [Cellvibrionales bacterium]
MSNSVKAVLFDLDGTLMDTAADFTTALNQLLIREQRPPLIKDEVRALAGDGSAGLIRAVFDIPDSDPESEPLRQAMLENYAACLTEKTRLFTGFADLLTWLDSRTLLWGIVTNKPLRYARPIVQKLAPACATLICPEHVAHPKPSPEGLLLAAKQLEVDARTCLYVGDHKRDIEAGQAAGMRTIAACWGYIDPQTDNPAAWNADYLIDRPADLQPLIEKLIQ